MRALDLVGSDTRRRLLQLIKRRGSLSLDDAMQALDMARTTVREHLLRLEEKDLVERFTRSEGRGRPRLYYKMTPRAQILFPSRDGELLGELITFLEDHAAEDLVASFFEHYWAERTQRVQQQLDAEASDDLEARLRVLLRILEAEGFMPKVEHDGGQLTIRECNCPFPETVKRTHLPCRLEAAFYEALFDTDVERTRYMPDGAASCSYALPVPSPSTDEPPVPTADEQAP
ncbi:helix-turn-helix transcriptional regulator [Salisaeta longa]|uniref:helix-turn-helix transcriptional regulator n=1 Tax=Salisaeta longa TaxID=503170 RepID=UPI0003B65390|nr:DeoR family transcriptional regulator [Salisaeta longa]